VEQEESCLENQGFVKSNGMKDMNKKSKPEKSGISKTNFQIIAGFFIAAFAIGSVLSLTTVTKGFGYQCFDTIKKCVCNGSDKDCNTMKSKVCKGEVVDNKCTKKLVNDELKLTFH
jgi:hypothetical protein